jgi:NADH-quinone oxidoreductase subunit N
MNVELLGPELVVIGLALALILIDLVMPESRRPLLGVVAAFFMFALFLYSAAAFGAETQPRYAFGEMYVADGLALFFKALFFLAAGIVLLLAVEWGRERRSGVTEYFVLILFALAGMLFAASANDFAVLYVSIELVTVTFYILTSYERGRAASLEAGVKYLILGALSSAFMVYGIALCFGASGTLSFSGMAAQSEALAGNRLFQLGLLLVLGGLAFKVAIFPFQAWAPDVYEGAPTPTTAFLAIGSKGAGVVLLVRLLGSVVPDLALRWEPLWMAIAAITILYGSLCAIPQRSLRRLLGYSSIANAGFVMMGIAAMSKTGSAAVLFYLAGYLFTVLAAFFVVSIVVQRLGSDDFSALAGLHQRCPLLATALALAVVSLAGVPPLAGFFGKFLVLKALVEQGTTLTAWYWLAAVAIIGVAISFWYYFGILRALYWSERPADASILGISRLSQAAVLLCVAGMLYLGVFPGAVWSAALAAVSGLKI